MISQLECKSLNQICAVAYAMMLTEINYNVASCLLCVIAFTIVNVHVEGRVSRTREGEGERAGQGGYLYTVWQSCTHSLQLKLVKETYAFTRAASGAPRIIFRHTLKHFGRICTLEPWTGQR